MKIKYETPDNLFKFYNETVEIGQKRKKIEKYGNVSIFNQLVKYSLYALLFGTCIIVLMNLKRNDILYYMIIAVSIFFLGCSLVYIIIFIINYNTFKKNGIKGTITINEKNIIDKDEKYKLEISLDKISSIIIGKYSINIFLLNSNIYLRIPIIYGDKIVNEVKKYREDIRVIQLNNN